MTRIQVIGTIMGVIACAPASQTRAEDLYHPSSWPALSADDKAANVGDTLTVLVLESAEATNSAQNNSRKKTDTSGSFSAGSIDESANLEFGGGYTGRGETRRSEKLVAQLTVTVQKILPNGDLVIGGQQQLLVNGETTTIDVRGRVRRADISGDNTVLSGRIAEAQINYDGHGFVSRSAKPGIINRIFSFLGLG
jgi:flagellar L-ring protein precursor FlgH